MSPLGVRMSSGSMLRKLLLALLAFFASINLMEGRGAERNFFELRGTVVPEGGISVEGGRVAIQLAALSGPWSGKELSAVPHVEGRFRFKRIPTGMYLLTAFGRRAARAGAFPHRATALFDSQPQH